MARAYGIMQIVLISIHAPTRGATVCIPLNDAIRFISIHAPTRGATRWFIFGCIPGLNFNPRSYKRSDMQAHDENMEFLNFNPRSYKRSDFAISINFHYVHRFQSTLLQEERRKLQVFGIPSYYFNPRSYKRSDKDLTKAGKILSISIHAPTRGATYLDATEHQKLEISIHAPTRGATLSHTYIPLNSEYFNPRSYKRSD